jgi:hypothetical protein
MSAVVTVNDVLDGRVVLDVECLDRIYFNVLTERTSNRSHRVQ